MPRRCCSPSESMRFQCASSSSRSREIRQTDCGDDFRHSRGQESAGLGRIGDRGPEGVDWKIWPLRQDHDLVSARHA